MPNPLHALFSRARGTISAPASEPTSPKKEPRRSKDDSQLKPDRIREALRERERDSERLDDDERGDEVEGRGGVAEQELRRLQRAYRLLEAERRSYAEQTSHTINKQKATISSMQSDNLELERQIDVLTKMKTKGRTMDIESIKREIATYTSKVNGLSSSVTTTTQSINSLQTRMGQLRQLTSGSNSLSSESHALAQQLKSSESRLDKATERYNELLTSNRKLRDSISSVRHELAAYSGAWKKLEKESMDVKKRMGDLVVTTNNANAGRDASQVRLLRLKEIQTKEKEAYEREMRELQRKREADQKLKHFLEEKLKVRLERKVELEKERREIEERGSGSIAALHSTRGARETVEIFGEILSELRKLVATWEGPEGHKGSLGELDAKQLIHKFTTLEHRGYSLFSYVNELGMRAANYRAKIATIRDEIHAAEQRREHKSSGTEEKKDKLEKSLSSTNTRIAHLKSQLSQHESALEAFLAASRGLCMKLSSLAPIVPAKIRFTPPPPLQVGVTPETALELLRFAEEKAVELMAVKERLMGTALASSANPGGSRPGTASYRSRPGTGSAPADSAPTHQRSGSVAGRRRSSIFFGMGSSVKKSDSGKDSESEDGEEGPVTHNPGKRGSRATTPKREETWEKRVGWVPFETPSVTREDWDAPPSDEDEIGEVRMLSREELTKLAKASIDKRKKKAAASNPAPPTTANSNIGASSNVAATSSPKKAHAPVVTFSKQADSVEAKSAVKDEGPRDRSPSKASKPEATGRSSTKRS